MSHSASVTAGVSDPSTSNHISPGTVVSSAVPVVLRQRADFLAANGGLRVGTPGFVLLVKTRNDGSEMQRIGYTVTKKIGNAVTRNRIKRRFRALVHQAMPAHGIAGADHVLIGRGEALTRDFAAMRDDLVRALNRVRDGKA
ncbi:ribonuclease P protein component, partial [Blastomonas sp.]|uniref:ribonuclease P protein component n=1 Tax=Blastomonas sp. TaxID=1909299 RepID=UPI003593E878